MMPTLSPLRSRTWRLHSTPPMTGSDNMLCDLDTLERVSHGAPPVVRFFQWFEPTVSYGRLQKRTSLEHLIPPGWASVQRPTGGGLVFHDQDLCVSLCWQLGTPPLPSRLRDHYQWIHQVIGEALQPLEEALTMAHCTDCAASATPFETRDCFTEPVVYDLLAQGRKVVGGALYRRGSAFLYQGSIQGYPASSLQPRLRQAFQNKLNAD